ncbi:hypothetical protein PF001_g18947, partial [Phytophthora fragariae]
GQETDYQELDKEADDQETDEQELNQEADEQDLDLKLVVDALK